MKQRICLLFLVLLSACGGGPPSPVTSAYIVQAFRDSGLNIANETPVARNTPGAVEATDFDLPNVGIGRVVTFASASDAQPYGGRSHHAGEPWYFQKGIVVLRLSVSVDEATAHQYEKALNDLKY